MILCRSQLVDLTHQEWLDYCSAIKHCVASHFTEQEMAQTNSALACACVTLFAHVTTEIWEGAQTVWIFDFDRVASANP